MTRKPRLALIALGALGCCGLATGSAAAAINTPAVTGATHVTPESATLNAVIDTGGLNTTYEFAYDTAADYKAGGDNAMYAPSPPALVPGSTSLVPVSAAVGCYPASTCGQDGIPLQPNTTYVYFVQSAPGSAGNNYYAISLTSPAGTFKTPALGSVALGSTKLKVKRGKAPFALRCKGTEKCIGTYKLTARVKHRTVTCASGKYSLTGGASKTLSAGLKGSCTAALRKAKGHKLGATLTTTSKVDQKGLRKKVTLKG